jgi:hypothetical protein
MFSIAQFTSTFSFCFIQYVLVYFPLLILKIYKHVSHNTMINMNLRAQTLCIVSRIEYYSE